MAAISAQNHTRAIFARRELYVWHVVRVDEPQEDSFRVADAAIWHFKVWLSRRDFQLSTDTPLVVDQFEGSVSNHRGGALRVIRLLSHDLQREDSEVQEEQDQKHAIGFHGS